MTNEEKVARLNELYEAFNEAVRKYKTADRLYGDLWQELQSIVYWDATERKYKLREETKEQDVQG